MLLLHRSTYGFSRARLRGLAIAANALRRQAVSAV
jgi:hypothetical protein